MSTSKGSKIALAVAGLILVAGTATAIAMTQKDGGSALPIFGTEESAPAEKSETMTPAEPSAEIGESLKTGPDAQDDDIPGMNNLENSEGLDKPTTIFDGATEKAE
ncbi:hypothetical protein ACTU44_08365 [Thalassospira sp. SM2505]|uniref:Uncharacterized protein n=1 Tax=Thalassospira profundimaris TaxID=502049 RepID=A0A367WTB9_9PROT|nr:hypothetical protein [Thalassospira profundimaris]RCK43781.1 hypothetical protein TH30_17520 [Thalassospira profundimaris]